MDYMDPDVHCPKKAVKLALSLTHSLTSMAAMLENGHPLVTTLADKLVCNASAWAIQHQIAVSVV